MPFRLLISLLCCILLWPPVAAGQEQQYQRIQYHHYRWQVFHTPVFHLYYPQGYDSLAGRVTELFPAAAEEVSRRMFGTLPKDPQLILYPSVDQLYESNVGSTQPGTVTLPTIISKGNRLLVPFTGSYTDMADQLRLAISRAVWESWFKSSLQQQVTYEVQQPDIPTWYREGVIRYMALGWPLEDENRLAALLQLHAPDKIAAEHPALWGAGFCYFLAQRYYPQAPQQLLSQVRQKKSLPRATRLVTQRPLRVVDSTCADFYRHRYTGLPVDSTGIPSLPEGTLRRMVVSPDGEIKAVVVEKATNRELWLKREGREPFRRISRYPLPPWITGHTSDPYPVITFDGDQLLAASPRRGKLEVRMYYRDGRQAGRRVLRLPDGLDELHVLDRNDWLLHAWKLGQQAMVHYDPQRERYSPVDSSNHLSAIRTLQKDTVITSETELLRYYRWDSLSRKLNSNHTGSREAEPASPWHEDRRRELARKAAEDSILNAARDTTQSFLSGVLGGKNKETKQQKDSLDFDRKKAQPYLLQLYSAYFSAQVNNDYYINRYQPYQNYQGQFRFPEAGAQAKGGFSDLFENHHFTIAYRLPAGSDGSDFFVSYRNTQRKLDWGLTYFRKVEQLSPDPYRNWTGPDNRLYPNAGKVKTHYYELNLQQPLSWYSAIDFSTALRYDRTIFTALDLYSLKAEDLKQSWSVNTVAYHIDKRQTTGMGLYKGFYGKAGIDAFSSVSGQGGTTFGLYTKLEYHRPLYKGITLATRLQGGYSAGTGRILYNFGGTDGNLAIRVDSTVHFRQEAPYVFQTLVTPFRGYLQNSLYGDRYALLNVDVYVPLFGELIDFKTPLPSINNLQLGLFTDIAGASENYKNVVKDNKDQWLYSVGFSARTILAGYPIRFDIGWPGRGGKPVWYLNLTL